MIGIEYLNRIVDERIAHPSMAHTLGLRLTEVGEAGRAVIPGETCAALLSIPIPMEPDLPWSNSRSFVRPITVDTGKVTAEGRVVNRQSAATLGRPCSTPA